MDINSFISKEAIQEEMNKKSAGGEMSDSRFWRIPDKKSVIRLLPRLENKVPWKTVFSHRYNKNGEKLFSTCRKTFGQRDCPICKQSWSMWNEENKEHKDTGYLVRATPRYLFNCFIVNDPEKAENNGTIKLISVGKKLFDLILESYNADDLGPAIFDAVNGFNFEINRKQSGDNPAYPDYSSSRFVFKKEGIVKSWKEIEDKLINIDDIIKEESVDELRQKFAFLWPEGSTVVKSSSTPKVEKKVEKKPVVEHEDDDIDIVDELETADAKETEELNNLDDLGDIDDELGKL